MKLSSDTVEILKNFSTINQSLLFKKGNVLSTISPLKTVLAEAQIAETIPEEFAIYDLNKFLAKLSLYKNCDLQFDSDKVRFVSEDGKRSDYIKYCSAKVIVTPPEKKLNIGTADCSFDLTKEDLEWQRKSAGISGSPNFVFKSDGSNVYLVSTDVKDDSADLSKTEIASSDGSKFEVVMKVENFKVIDDAYGVEISKRGLAKFSNKNKKIEYYIAIESAQSKFD
jgi:hypothetical protein